MGELSLSGSEPPIPTIPVLRGAGIGILTMGRNNAAVDGMPPMDVTFSWEPKNVDPVMMGWNVTIMPRSRNDLFKRTFGCDQIFENIMEMEEPQIGVDYIGQRFTFRITGTKSPRTLRRLLEEIGHAL